jgi:hypothetical protein
MGGTGASVAVRPAVPATVGPRVLVLTAAAAITAAWVIYMSRAVPIPIHRLQARFVPAMTLTAITAFVVMVVIDAVILAFVVRHTRDSSNDSSRQAAQGRGIPKALVPKRFGLMTFAATALASVVAYVGLGLVGLPLWVMAAAALLPWLPLYVSEATWQYRHYGAFALFGTLVLLQIGHLSEHIVQNVQLYVSHGKLAASRGVFGQLDVETVHFYWNVAIWLGTGALLYRYGLKNVWLTIAFVAASLHSVEHIYMYWLYFTHSPAYVLGGWNGILGQGGLVGSPLARPYLHLVYNILEVTPFVIAYYDQSRLVFDREAAGKALAEATSLAT